MLDRQPTSHTTSAGRDFGRWLASIEDRVDTLARLASAPRLAGPVGSGALWFTATPPTGWLIADGSAIPAGDEYDRLRAALGGATTLPDMRGYLVRAASGTVALGSTGNLDPTAGTVPWKAVHVIIRAF